jgi:hypothetical protein
MVATLNQHRTPAWKHMAALIVTVLLVIPNLASVSAQAASPGPTALLSRASGVMNSIPTVSVVGEVDMYSGVQRSRLHARGDCDASGASTRNSMGKGPLFLKAESRFTGTSGSTGSTVSSDERFIVIGNGTKLRTWERSARTHNRWIENKTEGVAGLTTDLCSILFMGGGGVPTNTPTRYTTDGQTKVAGTVAWHVHMTVNPPGARYRFDWFIDTTSFRVLRSVTREADTHNPSGGMETYNYSRFGKSFHFAPPSS